MNKTKQEGHVIRISDLLYEYINERAQKGETYSSFIEKRLGIYAEEKTA